MGQCTSLPVEERMDRIDESLKDPESLKASGNITAKIFSADIGPQNPDTKTLPRVFSLIGAYKSGKLDPTELSAPSEMEIGQPSTFTPSDFEDGNARKMRLKHLKNATKGFSEKNVLGEGSFGKVYRGTITCAQAIDESNNSSNATESTSQISMEVAIKRLDPESFQGYQEYLSEILVLNSVRHPNLVRLVGHCKERNETLLVYEFCSKGALDMAIEKGIDGALVSWESRLQIALDIAKGLNCLHKHDIIHRDLKASNILLDKDMVAKVCDFGLAKAAPRGSVSHVSTRIMGTLGYLDPMYMSTGRLTKKSDIYAFGVILLELITGRQSVEEDLNIVTWMREFLVNRRPEASKFVDPKFGEDYDSVQVTRLSVVAKLCVNEDGDYRPDMDWLEDAIHKIQGRNRDRNPISEGKSI